LKKARAACLPEKKRRVIGAFFAVAAAGVFLSLIRQQHQNAVCGFFFQQGCGITGKGIYVLFAASAFVGILRNFRAKALFRKHGG